MSGDVQKPAPGDLARAVGDEALARELVARGADVNEKIGYYTPILAAADRGSPETMRLLLENGARTDHVNEYEWTPLHAAAASNRVEIVRLLLEFGAEVDARDQNGMTPLIRAASFGYTDTVQVLLEHGAEIGIKDKSLGTAQSRAARGEYHELIALLDMPVREWPRYRAASAARAAFNAGHGAVVEKQSVLRARAPRLKLRREPRP